MKKRTRRQKAIIRRRIFLSCCAAVLIAAVALIVFVVNSIPNASTKGSNQKNNQTTSKVETKVSFATVLSIGDIMAHSTQITGAKTSDGYDFSGYFKETSSYYRKADLAIGNLELTFGGTESGSYRGYPTFNTPDQLADAIKNSGISMLMTANNHSYDTKLLGLKRTVSVLEQKGIAYTGTRQTENTPIYQVKEVNGIKIGIVNFTYETQAVIEGRKYLNGLLLATEAESLVNTFSYQNINAFYTKAKDVIKNMKKDGAEYITFYMHWGEEYQLKANTWQKSIAQNLSNMGVDMIIGGHPHVVQPMELIHSEDGENTTVCIYSLGNAVSNQRRELISNSKKGHTEDGVMFSYTLKKSKNGEVSLVDVDLIPTWVNKTTSSGKAQYTIYPIESLEKAKQKYPNIYSKLEESYNRTKATVSEGLTECQKAIGCDVTFK